MPQQAADIAAVNADTEQQQKLQQCFDLLLAAGYFRARACGLSDFDRLVGGMVWCIRLCRVEVDVDLFYRDSLSLGQKIAVTERIVEALPALGCPHRLEPHQVQGCDADHVFPVVQWLVRQALENQTDSTAEHVSYGSYLLAKYFPAARSETAVSGGVYRELEQRFFSSLENRRPVEDPAEEESTLSNTRSSSGIDHTVWNDFKPEEAVRCLIKSDQVRIDPTLLNVNVGLCPRRNEQNSELCALQNQISAVEEQMHRVADQYFLEQQKFAENSATLQQDQDRLYSIEEETRSLTSSLSVENQERLAGIRERLQETDCVQDKIEALEKEIQCLTDSVPTGSSAIDVEQKDKLSRVRAELADVSRQVMRAQLKLHSVPDRAEVLQYQKRSIELFNLVYLTQREIKASYAANNMLADTLKYLNKELNMLNSIVDNYDAAKQTSTTRVEFLEQMDRITAAIVANKNSLSDKLREQLRQEDQLKYQVDELKDSARQYHLSVDQFREQCAINERLSKLTDSQRPE